VTEAEEAESARSAATSAEDEPATSSVRWRQIEHALRRSIIAGEYAPGSQLPPDRQIAANFGANRLTARRALASLEQQGLIRIKHGSGTFVSEDMVRYGLGGRVRFNRNLAATNFRPSRRVLRTAEVGASAAVAERLALGAGELILRVDLVGYANERPISVASRYSPVERFPGLAEAFKREQSFTAALREFGVHDYRRKVTEIIARLPTAREAHLLRQPKSQPVLASQSVDVDLEGVPISYQDGCFAGARAAFVIDSEL
jgi:GntR family transcriptional regulator, phosphonate transport system regulatory protein